MGGRQLDERKLAVLDGQESAVLRENNNLSLLQASKIPVLLQEFVG
jgi:hypothetical protein